MLNGEDRLLIHELLALYGHIADEGGTERLGELFTEDAVFDATDMGIPLARSLDGIARVWRNNAVDPLAHHSTNIVVTPEGPDRAIVLSKGLGVGNRGRVGSVTYRDTVRKTPAGWRFAGRVATLRRPAERPDCAAAESDGGSISNCRN